MMNNKKNWLYLIPVASFIIFLILAFGSNSGDDVKVSELTHISFTVSDYDIINDEDNTAESIVLVSKDYKCKFSIDAVDLISVDEFAKAINKGKTKINCFVVKSDLEKDNPDQIAQIYAVTADDKSFGVLNMASKSDSKGEYTLTEKDGKVLTEKDSISNEGMDAGSLFALIIPLIISIGSAAFIYFRLGKNEINTDSE